MGKEVGCHVAHNVKVQNSTLAIQQSTIFGSTPSKDTILIQKQ